jgi:hypothetical protein
MSESISRTAYVSKKMRNDSHFTCDRPRDDFRLSDEKSEAYSIGIGLEALLCFDANENLIYQ